MLIDISHQTKPLSIEPIRWDPLSGASSALTATLVDVSGCLTGMVTEPIRVYGEEKRQQAQASSSNTSFNPQQPERVDNLKSSSASIRSVASTKSRDKRPSAGSKAAMASAKSLAWLAPKAIKGFTLDMPLALAEGLHKAPKYYGDEVRDHGKVTGAGSGFAVGGKSLAWGLVDGISGLGVQPYKEYKKSGTVGLATGFGAFAHPVAGIAKSVRSAVYNQSRKLIDSQRAAEGQWLVEDQQWTGSQVCALMEKFKALGSK
jgi:hypothetical protein